MKAKTVGARELKTRLGTYLREVQKGRLLVVTERGRPVAELRPLTVEPDDLEARLEQLVREGFLSRAHGAPWKPFRPIRVKSGWSGAKAVAEDREDRF